MPSDNEWFTPHKYIEAAREVMGGIDLDPASCKQANQVVQATHYYSREENGLMHPWSGRVWLNPPYCKEGHSSIAKWSQKLLGCYFSGEITQCVLLVAGQTASRWFHPLWEFPICFANSHIHFYRPGLVSRSQRDCTCFAYLGPNETHFIDVFSQFGRVVRAIDTPAPKPTMLDLWTTTVA